MPVAYAEPENRARGRRKEGDRGGRKRKGRRGEGGGNEGREGGHGGGPERDPFFRVGS